jgi:hypothetical protein
MKELKLIHEQAPAGPKSWIERNQLIVSFLLTSVLGSGISLVYQRFADQYEQAKEVRVAHRKESRDFLLALTDLAERRNYYAFRIISALEEIQAGRHVAVSKKSLEDDGEKYRKAVEEWNLRRHYFERFLEVHISPDYRKKFYERSDAESVVNLFRALHNKVLQFKIAYENQEPISAADIQSAKDLREKLSWQLASLYDELLRRSMDQ